MRNRQKSLMGFRLGAAPLAIILAISARPAWAQSPSRALVKEPAATKCAEGLTGGQEREPQAGQSPEEIELLRLRVETERDQLRLAESRLEQAARREARASELAQSGRVPIEQFIAAQDNALVKQSDVVAQKAALKAAELRLAQAQRGTASDRPVSSAFEGRLADLERRLAAAERAVRSLRQETEHVELDLPIQVISGRR